MKFILFVEGHSEKKGLASFLKRWLDPRLPRQVGILTVRFSGWADLIKDAPTRVANFVGDPNVIGIIGLIDLYGPKYPRSAVTVEQRCRWLKNTIERSVKRTKFRQHFAVHELEAWLLSSDPQHPSVLPPKVAAALPTKKPEDVNFKEPPKKLLSRLYQKHLKLAYRETTHTLNLLNKLDPNVAYASCAYLKRLLDDMLALAVAARSRGPNP